MGTDNYVVTFFGINSYLDADTMRRISKKYKDSSSEWKSFWQDYSNEFEKKDPDMEGLASEFFQAMNLGKKYTLVEIGHEDLGPMNYIAIKRISMREWGYGSGTTFEMDFEKKKIMFTARDTNSLKKIPQKHDFPTSEEITTLKKWRDEIDVDAKVGFVSISEYH
jgi:hypothetical protein